jgi:hypothetical protein
MRIRSPWPWDLQIPDLTLPAHRGAQRSPLRKFSGVILRLFTTFISTNHWNVDFTRIEARMVSKSRPYQAIPSNPKQFQAIPSNSKQFQDLFTWQWMALTGFKHFGCPAQLSRLVANKHAIVRPGFANDSQSTFVTSGTRVGLEQGLAESKRFGRIVWHVRDYHCGDVLTVFSSFNCPSSSRYSVFSF